MNALKKVLAFVGLVCLTFVAQSQTAEEIILYSQQSYGSTARSAGMAGAFGALGGDFSVLSTNPAGIAQYRSNEVSFTPNVQIQNNSNLYLNSITEENGESANVNQFGVVFSRVDEPTRNPDLKTIAFAFGMNRLANYNLDNIYMGENFSNSLMTSHAEFAGNSDPEDLNAFNEGLSWETFLLDTISSNPYEYIGATSGGVVQNNVINQTGGLDEFVISAGANFNHKIYVGGTLALPTLERERTRIYTETSLDDNTDFEKLTFQEDLTTSGNGVNAKLGVIYRANEFLRIGTSFHSPTWYTMNDEFSSSMVGQFTSETYDAETEVSAFNYRMRTPWRAMASIAAIFKDLGLLSIDYEMVDYSTAKLSSSIDGEDEAFFNGENTYLKSTYGKSHNMRIGVEKRLKQFGLRAGYALYSSPFNNSQFKSSEDGAIQLITGGIGYRSKKWFADIAFQHNTRNELTTPYSLQNETSPIASSELKNSSASLSVGLRF